MVCLDRRGCVLLAVIVAGAVCWGQPRSGQKPVEAFAPANGSAFTMTSKIGPDLFGGETAADMLNLLNAELGLFGTVLEKSGKDPDDWPVSDPPCADVLPGLTDVFRNASQLFRPQPTSNVAAFGAFKIGWEINRIIRLTAEKHDIHANA